MNNPLYRPPAEASSLILQLDEGCPHNTCTFCGMYKQVTFKRKSIEDCHNLIELESQRHAAHTRRIFLADGDVMSRPFLELKEILSLLAESFPQLTRVSTYANGRSVNSKTETELNQLRKLKLHTLYLGLESGSAKVLKRCRKKDAPEDMISACCAAQSAGLRMSVMILLGLGGKALSSEHATKTADALNRMQPRLLSALRVVPVPGTELYSDCADGVFSQLTEHEVVCELRSIISMIDLTSTVFRANHASNVIPVEARLPRDKERLLREFDRLIDSATLDRTSPGSQPLWL